MGWLTYMANGSKQDLLSSCFFIERFAIHHQYKGLNMMVIHLFWWCLSGTCSKHRFKSVCYSKLYRENLGCEEQKPPRIVLKARRDPRWAKHWMTGIMGGKYPQPNVYHCLCMKTHTHLSSDILHTHTHQKKWTFWNRRYWKDMGVNSYTNGHQPLLRIILLFFTRFPGFIFHLSIMSCRFNFNQRNRGFTTSSLSVDAQSPSTSQSTISP